MAIIGGSCFCLIVNNFQNECPRLGHFGMSGHLFPSFECDILWEAVTLFFIPICSLNFRHCAYRMGCLGVS